MSPLPTVNPNAHTPSLAVARATHGPAAQSANAAGLGNDQDRLVYVKQILFETSIGRSVVYNCVEKFSCMHMIVGLIFGEGLHAA